ncbi:MAG: hypothetical protein JSR97_09480 [Verrucomicrobia bacterium]|nr:hypothetical protein [Verrucomicrobiota bacterium]
MTVHLHATWQGATSTYQNLSRSESCSITLKTPGGRTFTIKSLPTRMDKQPHNLRFLENLTHHRQSCPHSFISLPSQDVASLQLSLTVSRIVDSPVAPRSTKVAPARREELKVELSSLPEEFADGCHYKMIFSINKGSLQPSPQATISKIEKITRSVVDAALTDTQIC